MKTITFGRYKPCHSIIHFLDARIKILELILLMVMIFLQFTLYSTSLILGGFYLLFFLLILFLSKVSFIDLFKSLSSLWIAVIFLLIIYIFVPNSSYKHVAFYINNYPIYYDAFYQSAYIILRLILVLSLTMSLTSTTKPLDLTYGFEFYMSPLKIIHFPSHEIAMTLSIALRFIPTILDEAKRISDAQASRGFDFVHGSIIKRIQGTISLIIPLFISAIERSEELANAMEARGYSPKDKRSQYREYKLHLSDFISLFIVLLIFSFILTLFIYDKNVVNIDIINWVCPSIHGF